MNDRNNPFFPVAILVLFIALSFFFRFLFFFSSFLILVISQPASMGVVGNVVVLAVLAGVAHLLSVFDPRFQPTAFVPEAVSGRLAAVAPRLVPRQCRVLSRELQGAEDYCFLGEHAYTALMNGSVVRFAHQASPTTFRAEKVLDVPGGRPLGLRFHPKTGDLWIVDAYKVRERSCGPRQQSHASLPRVRAGRCPAPSCAARNGPVDGLALRFKSHRFFFFGKKGLLSWNSKHGLVTHLSQLDGITINFADHLTISRDGERIFFSDASTKYGMCWILSPCAPAVDLMCVLYRYERPVGRTLGGQTLWPRH